MKHLVALLLIVTGCSLGGALTAKAGPTDLRYYSPEGLEVRTTNAVLAKPAAPALRLGRVTSGPSLRTHIVYRESSYELGMYDTLRWTDNPEVFVRRALERALFDDGAARESESGDVPTLDVEVVAFEELRSGIRRAGRVELRYTLHDDDRVLDSGTVVMERPADGNDMGAIVPAIAEAMQGAVAEVTRRVLQQTPR